SCDLNLALHIILSSLPLCFFFFDTLTTALYTLSLHDALPICQRRTEPRPARVDPSRGGCDVRGPVTVRDAHRAAPIGWSSASAACRGEGAPLTRPARAPAASTIKVVGVVSTPSPRTTSRWSSASTSTNPTPGRSATAAVHTRALRAHEEQYLLEIWTSVRSAPSRGVQALGSVVPASTARTRPLPRCRSDHSAAATARAASSSATRAGRSMPRR